MSLLPWTRKAKNFTDSMRLPWEIGYDNHATGELTIVDSKGQTVCRLGASHSTQKNAKVLAHFIIKAANSYGGGLNDAS